MSLRSMTFIASALRALTESGAITVTEVRYVPIGRGSEDGKARDAIRTPAFLKQSPENYTLNLNSTTSPSAIT